MIIIKTVGIPRALTYYRYKYLFSYFFNNLGVNTALSDDSNIEILKNGSALAPAEACLSLKLFLGHVNFLKDKCDFVLIPRVSSLKKREVTCTYFYALYDIVKVLIDVPILEFNVDYENNINERYAFIKLGMDLGFSYKDSKCAYLKAKEMSNDKRLEEFKKQELLLNTNNKKILLAGNDYILFDSLIGKRIASFLEERGITVIYSVLYYDEVLEDTQKISETIYWTYGKEELNAIDKYRKNVDGIILLSSFPCGALSLINELITRKVDELPIINIIMDEELSETGVITRLESFIDILEGVIYEG